ncbi:PspC domain-containing protein [Arcanobacterium hippocoleae]|uniref:Signal transduction histidine kinase n=1 Tax=Arcanobacterium hippocoleae TaxID=149017 RepID=A0ABU1SZS1_9ACTO|nr:PspC domain-containing protein [Arcanobacterium hippocoleae]MDR6938631.1 signal transduction histidine kinase [Arcanobacterium hippocoleae]
MNGISQEEKSHRPPFYRQGPRIFGGVCRALSVHLGMPAWIWRLAFIMLTFTGVIPLLYLLLWILVPWYRREYEIEIQNQRLARGLDLGPTSEDHESSKSWFLLVAVLISAGAFFLITTGIAPGNREIRILGAGFMLLAGAGIIWSTPIDSQRNKRETTALNAARKVVAVIGGGICVVGAVILVLEIAPRNPFFLSLTIALITVITLCLVFYPAVLRLKFSLRETAAQKARESVRADMAAHLHDSVLQSLALIRARADDADAVRTLARLQEQDLRKYLYSERQNEDTSTAALLREIAQELERRYQKEINTVITGDCKPDTSVRAVLAATREAITNACKYGGEKEVSLYAELRQTMAGQKSGETVQQAHLAVQKDHLILRQSIEVWIRDRGPGFDPHTIAPDRAGIRDSIIGRLRRIGGSAEIRSPLQSGGTEVHLKYQG